MGGQTAALQTVKPLDIHEARQVRDEIDAGNTNATAIHSKMRDNGFSGRKNSVEQFMAQYQQENAAAVRRGPLAEATRRLEFDELDLFMDIQDGIYAVKPRDVTQARELEEQAINIKEAHAALRERKFGSCRSILLRIVTRAANPEELTARIDAVFPAVESVTPSQGEE